MNDRKVYLIKIREPAVSLLRINNIFNDLLQLYG